MVRYSALSREELEQKCYWAEKKVEELETENKKLYEEREHYRFRLATELERCGKTVNIYHTPDGGEVNEY